MGGWPRALVGVLIGATLGAGTARAASLRASFDPSPDPSVDTYLVFTCQGDATVCTQGSYVSTPDTWTLVDSQPAAVVCAPTPCAQTFFVVDPAAGQTETLTIILVAESQAADPAAPSLSGPSNVISVTLSGAPTTTTSTSSTTSTTRVPTTTTSTSSTTSTTRVPTTTTSTSSTTSTTRVPTTTTSTSSTTSTTSSTTFTTTTTSATPPTTLPSGIVCGYPYRSGGGLSVGWDSYAGIRCVTGGDPAGYAVVDGHVYVGQPGDPPSFKLSLYESNGASGNARQPAGTPLCESDLVTLVPGDNVIPLAGCPVLAPGTSYFIIFVAASPDTQIADLRRRACRRSGSRRTGRHTSAGDSISDPFPDADGAGWLDDFCQETIWLDLVPAGE